MTEQDHNIAEIEALVADLASDEAMVRQRARHRLVRAGEHAVPHLCDLARSDDDQIRWECSKALSVIADPRAIDALLFLLEDEGSGAAWGAAIGLIAIGDPAVKPLLRAIIDRAQDFAIIAGAHHVLYELTRNEAWAHLRSVYEALDTHEPAVTAPAEAMRVLREMESNE